jgi:hypothetical protein
MLDRILRWILRPHPARTAEAPGLLPRAHEVGDALARPYVPPRRWEAAHPTGSPLPIPAPAPLVRTPAGVNIRVRWFEDRAFRFPPLPQTPLAPVEHVRCKIYYPTWDLFDPQQRAFYLYFRQEARRGNYLPADATYRFFYAYEVAARTRSLRTLGELWADLWRAYTTSEKGSFRYYLARWIADARLASAEYQVDDVTAEIEPLDALDLTLLGNVQVPSSLLLRALRPGAIKSEEAARLLDAVRASSDLVADVAAGLQPFQHPVTLFATLGSRRYLRKFTDLERRLPSISRNPEFTAKVLPLLDDALRTVTPSMTAGPPIGSRIAEIAVTVPGNEQRVPFARSTLRLPPLPSAESVDGLWFSIRNIWGAEVITLLATVVGLSERYPFIEGRVDASRLVRDPFQQVASALGVRATIASFRDAYFSLGSGTRAVWTIDPTVQLASDVKIGSTTARFLKSLQHGLIGTETRRILLDRTIGALAQQLSLSRETIGLAISRGTNASAAILPAELAS